MGRFSATAYSRFSIHVPPIDVGGDVQDEEEHAADGINLGAGASTRQSGLDLDLVSNMRYELIPSLCPLDTAEEVATSMGLEPPK